MATKVYSNEKEDLAKIIAQYASGIKGAIPERRDFELAGKVISFIENEIRETW